MTFFYDLNKRLADIAGAKQLNESAAATQEDIYMEKIEPPIKTDPAERGKYKGHGVADLKKQMASVKHKMAGYKERGEKVPAELRGKFSELTFAIRAKQAHGGKWNKIKEEGQEHLDEISLDQIGRGIGKAMGVPARVAGAVAGIPQGMKQAYQTSKQGAIKAISGQDVDCYPKTSKMAEDDMDESALQAYLGKKKYGEAGMKALQKAGREGASKDKMAQIRARHDKMDEADMEEGNEFSGELAQARAAGAKSFKVDGKEYPVKEGAKPDFLDIDKDGNRKESMKKAARDAKLAKIDMAKEGIEDVPTYIRDKMGKPRLTPADLKRPGAFRFRVGEKEFMDRRAAQEFAAGTGQKVEPISEKKEKTLWPGTPEYEKKFPKDMRTGEKRKSSTGGEIEKTATGIKHTARYDDDDDKGDDKLDHLKGPKIKGRPKGSKHALGAKGPTGKSKLLNKAAIKEEPADAYDTARAMAKDYYSKDENKPGQVSQRKTSFLDRAKAGYKMAVAHNKKLQKTEDQHMPSSEYDQEGAMAKDQLHTIEDAVRELRSIIDSDENLPEWVQSKITKAVDYIDTARDYLAANEHEPVAEKAVSKAQQRFMGMVHAAQKGERPASKEVAKVAKDMPKKAAKDFAKTKHKGLPEKVKKDESVEETADEAPKAPKKMGGIQFGKGVYEAMDEALEKVITESINISVNMSTDEMGQPRKSISVNAEGDDADKLAQLLNLAGINGHQEQVHEVDENDPDWPTDEVESGEDPDLRMYSGGLNKPKSSGQTVDAPPNLELRRNGFGVKESADMGMNLYRELQQFKAK